MVLLKPEYLVVYVPEGLVFEEEEHGLLVDIYWEIENRAGQQEEIVVRTSIYL